MGSQPELLTGSDVAGGGLQKETNWWGAFVIGLAGTILVTGIAPIMVNAFGAAAVPQMAVITLSGYLLCLLLAELSAMMPDRTGGSPTYAMVAYRDRSQSRPGTSTAPRAGPTGSAGSRSRR